MTIRTPIIARWLAILNSRPDSEHEMTLNRMAFALIVIAYLGIAAAAGSAHASAIFYSVYPVFVGYIIGSIALFAHILYQPQAMPTRRIFAAIYDMAMISYAAHACGTAAGFFYPLYLWTIFGNGFRFGVFYLGVAVLVGIVGFTAVLILTGFWRQNPGFSFALIVGLVMLPAYVSRLIRKLSEAKYQAEEASKAKSQFLASVTHELRTPLNAIIGLSGLISDTNLDREHSEMMDTIRAAAHTLLGHINTILDLSRVEAGKTLSRKSEFDLYELLIHVRNIVAVKKDDLKVSVHIASRTPQLIVGARQHLEQILLNLAGNAVKFTTHGYVVIAVDAVPRGIDQVRLRFEISDSGIGISLAAQKRIFESFAQADDTIIDRFGGTGLGLALCKQLVELQGGEIGVESALGAGSTFWFEIDVALGSDQLAASAFHGHAVLVCTDDRLNALIGSVMPNVKHAKNADQVVGALTEIERSSEYQPIAVFDACPGNSIVDAIMSVHAKSPIVLIRVVKSSWPWPISNSEQGDYATTLQENADISELMSVLQIAAAIAGRKTSGTQTAPRTQSNRELTILVADDNRTNQIVLSKVLERAGHKVYAVDNGAEAVEALCCERYDLAIMDLNMPVLNGVDAFKKYRSSLGGRVPIPVIALTADGTANDRCSEVGFQACATKPIEPHHLLEIIADVMNRSSCADTALVPEAGNRMMPAPSEVESATKVKRDTLQKLERLGGHSFVMELINQFMSDGDNMLDGLKLAVAEKNASKFDDELHAMRSSAGNIGAAALYHTCLSLKKISPEELVARGEEHLQKVTAELEDARRELAAYLSETCVKANSANQAQSMLEYHH